jgi:hypothetical protein
MYENHTSEYQRRLLSEDLERKLAAEIANRKKCCRDGNRISDELFDTQQKLKKADAEVVRLKEEARVGNIALDNLRGEVDLWFNRFREAARQLDSLKPQA